MFLNPVHALIWPPLLPKVKSIRVKSITILRLSYWARQGRCEMLFSSSRNHIKPYQTMTEWAEELVSTFRGSTEGSFARKVWNWLQMVVHRLLGESMGRASMKEAMLSRQCSMVLPAGRLFLLFKPWQAEACPITRLHNVFLYVNIFPLN